MPSIKKKDYELLQHRATLYEEARTQCEILDAEITAANRTVQDSESLLVVLQKSHDALWQAHDDLLALYGAEVRKALLAETRLKGAEMLSEMQSLCSRDEYRRYNDLKALTDVVIAGKDKKIQELTLELEAKNFYGEPPVEIPTCLKPYDAIEWAANLPEDIREDCQTEGFLDRLKRKLKWS